MNKLEMSENSIMLQMGAHTACIVTLSNLIPCGQVLLKPPRNFQTILL